MTNKLHGLQKQLQLNRYSNEPHDAGHGQLIDLPPSFDPLGWHDYTIRWSTSRIECLVDGILVGSETTFIPAGPMHIDVVAWAPSTGPNGWPEAYSASLEPVTDPGSNRRFVAYLRSVEVRRSP